MENSSQYAAPRGLWLWMFGLWISSLAGCRWIAEGEAVENAAVEVAHDRTGAWTNDLPSTLDVLQPVRARSLQPQFLGRSEPVILDRLSHGRVVQVKRTHGGRSVAFKVTLEDGTLAFFKPEQQVQSAQWHAEVVAYYLDRALGLGRVAPVASRALPWDMLQAAGPDDASLDEVIVRPDGSVRGAMIWWLPERLTELVIPPGWESWLRVEPWQPWLVSPLQRPREYVRTMQRKRREFARGAAPPSPPDGWAGAPDDPERPAALSDMVLFDYLIQNNDRWGGGNANVLTLGGGPLIFLDNGAGFSPGPHRRSLMERRLRVVQCFRRQTVEAIRNMDMTRFTDALARDPWGPLLTTYELKGLRIRRQALIEHVDAQVARFGDRALPW